MGRTFRHLSFTMRLRLEAFLKAKMKKKQIAEELGVHISTVYREVKRGAYQRKISYQSYLDKLYRMVDSYSPDIAEEKYRNSLACKGAAIKLSNDFSLAEYIENKIINDKYSPEAVLKEIKRKNLKFTTSICTNTLYSYIEKGVFARLSLKDLPEKGKRKNHKRRVVAARAPRGTSIEQRPEEIAERNSFGHWEMDCVCGPTKSVLLVLTERLSRREIIMKMKNQRSDSVIHALNVLERRYGSLFRKVFKSITVDNGCEFSNFAGMEKSSFGGKRTSVFYCHPYNASERGSNERYNREIRRLIPKGTNIVKCSDSFVSEVESWLNNYPRRVLGFATANEVYNRCLATL